MECTVIIEGVVNNVVESQIKSGSPVWKYQIESYKEDGTKRFGEMRSYEDKHLKPGDAVFMLCFQTHRIWKDQVYVDIQAFKDDRQKIKLENLKQHFQDVQKPSTVNMYSDGQGE